MAFSLSGTDILKLLDQIPIWKAITTLPKRVKELEDRVAVLEGKTEREASPTACPLCGEDMHVTAETADPIFAAFGAKERTLTCGVCGNTTERQWHPDRGYGG